MVVLSANETLCLVIARGHAKFTSPIMKGVIYRIARMALTININSKEGKYFVKQILPKCKHMVTIRSSKVLDGYTDYIMGIEDYYIAQELLEKIES